MQQFHSPKIPTLTRKLIILTVLLVLLWPRGNNFVQSRPHRSTPVVTIKGNMIMKNNVPVLQQNHRSKFRTKRATTGTAPDFDDTSHDIVSYVDYSSGGTMDDSDIFDMRRQETLFCTLCLWVQPNFAVHFGFGSLSAGISETIQLVELLSWVFRALDINMDTVPDSIALILGQVLVQDLPNLPLTNASSGDATKTTLIELSGSGGAGHKLKYSTKIASINPTTTLPFLESQLPQKFSKGKNNKCCATLSFVYHDIPKVLSVTSLRGVCSPHNVAIISGYHAGGKVTLYDLFRATFHSLGHLFGANHDPPFDEDCFDKKVSQFLNPFVMEPEHKLNVGPRPNSMRFSYCSKSQMAVFLSSNLLTCLTSRRDEPFCGNGIVEEGEECDCGAPWQCVLNHQCCGSRDTFTPCQLNTNAVKAVKSSTLRCLRPSEW